ncbi:hypothetical protein HMPREF9554_02246 [Treponema phagedenis F0421]|nr:hypothetical protein HMPREF9554_02246 [Treponema phagedenis F0421]
MKRWAIYHRQNATPEFCLVTLEYQAKHRLKSALTSRVQGAAASFSCVHLDLKETSS